MQIFLFQIINTEYISKKVIYLKMDCSNSTITTDNLLTQIDNLTLEERKFLDCPVCHKFYRNPKTLDCGHTICARCLQGKNFHKKLNYFFT